MEEISMIENKSICPGRTMEDENGKRIQAHGAGMIYDNGTYYWYGENKEHTTGKTDIWTWGIRFYSSKDLVNWKDEGIVIPPDTENKESSLHPSKHVDRPHILYNQKTGRYICWLKLSEEEGYFLILSSQNLLGPYRIEKDLYRPFGTSVGDFDLWQDEEGNGFLYFEHDHAGVISTELTEDFLETQGEYLDMFTGLNPPYTREGCTHFVYNGKHYLLTSGMIGYIPNPSEIAVSDSPLGPYTVLGDPHVDDESSASFNSQISCVFHDPARPGLYLVMADRWVPEYVMTKKRYEQLERVISSQSNPEIHPSEEDYKTAMDAPFLGNANTSVAEYVWLPLNLKGEYPVIEWKDEWKIEDYE